MKFIETIQSLAGNLFNLVGINRDPMFHGPIQVSTKAQRTLSHLVAQDGVNARLIRCLTDGSLVTVPAWLLREPDYTGLLTSSTTGTADLTSAVRHIVQVTINQNSTAQSGIVYESDMAGAKDLEIAVCRVYQPCLVYAQRRYIDVLSPTGELICLVRSWNI